MNKQQKAEQLLNMLDRATPVHRAAQERMLEARDAMKIAEDEYKDQLVYALGNVKGVNAEERKAKAHYDPDVRDKSIAFALAEREFNAAYRNYKLAEADLAYIRDATALLREIV